MFHDYKGLVRMTIKKIKVLQEKLGQAIINMKIGEQGHMEKTDLRQGQDEKNTDFLSIELTEDQTGRTAFLRFPMAKMVEMPRVKHSIEGVLVEVKGGKVKKPLVKMVQVNMDLQYFNAIMGTLIITSLEVDLTRDTDIITEMDPYIVVYLSGQKYKTVSKNGEGRSCIWHERIELKVTSVEGDDGVMIVRVYDEDLTKDDLVGEKFIPLLKEGLLKPEEKPIHRDFNLLYEGISAGTVKLQYQFVLMPYNF